MNKDNTSDFFRSINIVAIFFIVFMVIIMIIGIIIGIRIIKQSHADVFCFSQGMQSHITVHGDYACDEVVYIDDNFKIVSHKIKFTKFLGGIKFDEEGVK